jgi:hypothetical protein
MPTDVNRRGFVRQTGTLGLISLTPLGTVTSVLTSQAGSNKRVFPPPFDSDSVSVIRPMECLSGCGHGKCAVGACGSGFCHDGGPNPPC